MREVRELAARGHWKRPLTGVPTEFRYRAGGESRS
jgi:hypothetical protein